MKRARQLTALFALTAVVAACTESPTSNVGALYDDAALTADVAASAGDAAATALETMQANEATALVPGSEPGSSAAAPEGNLSVSRARICYDLAGTVVAACSPISSVRKIVTMVTVDGSRSGTHNTSGGSTSTWSGAVHLVASDTLVRNFNTASPPAEVSRTHTSVATGHDTITFTDGTLSRFVAATAKDTVKALTWNLPRSSNPWPASGSFVRAAALHVSVSKGERTETRDVAVTVQVDFPADAQGNVALKINSKTCNLNLVTHAVTNCQ